MSCWVLLSSPGNGMPVMAPVCLEFNHYNTLDESNSIPHPEYVEYVPLLVANPTLAGHRPPTTSTAFRTNTPEWALRSGQLDFVFHVDDQYIYDP